MSIIRKFLGAIILFFDWLFTPKGVKRSEEAQALVNQQSQQLALYQFKACPFCVKVRREMKRLSLPIDIRDAKESAAYRDELLAGGGRLKVPCLRIEKDDGQVSWMYESSDIVSYLQGQFGQPSA